jgi:hypothetical protein
LEGRWYFLGERALTATNRGAYFPEDTPTCQWTCASGSTGSTNAGSLTICRNACASACHATCTILF